MRRSAIGTLLVAAVTCYLLGRVSIDAASGTGTAIEVVVYSVTAAFGLEYLIVTWPSLWTRRRGRA